MISKKIIGLGALAVTVLALGACSSDNNGSKTMMSSSSKTEETSSSVDVVTTASISDKPDVLEKALSADGNWIVAATADVTFAENVTVAGEFHNKGEAANEIYRKLALYSQDADHKVTAEYTMTVPEMVVESENFNVVHGTVKGNILVKADGFVLNGAKVDGNVVFEKEEYKTSAKLDEEGAEVTGEVTVQ